jgi:tetratricopeptide (TPR) repeat protein
MRYVPNLIPKESKVLPDYFVGDSYDFKDTYSEMITLSYFGLTCCLILVFFLYRYPYLIIIFLFLSFLFLPQGHKWIERTFKFRFTKIIKSIFCLLVLLTAIPAALHYREINIKEAEQIRIAKKQAEQEKLIAEQKEQQRKDSLNFYLQAGIVLEKSNKEEEAINKLNYALSFTHTADEKLLVRTEKINVLKPQALKLIKAGKYETAIKILTNLIQLDLSNGTLFYNRAICYNKLGKIQAAVNDCRNAIPLGSIEASKLYEQLNPIKKRITGYHRQCCDGTTSYSEGRGTCSRHGGVCNWNVPEYEEYRKY